MMKISMKPTFTQITWIVREFFDLSQDSGFYLDSPPFLFSGDAYCLRLYPKVSSLDGDRTGFQVRRLSVTFPEREVYCRGGIRGLPLIGDVVYYNVPLTLEKNASYLTSWIEKNRDRYVPDGSLTVVCSMWLKEESRAEKSAQGEEEQQGFPGNCVSFCYRWSCRKTELSTRSPCTHVVPNLVELPRETGDSPLTSPEFRFAGDAYCLRFHPNGDTGDTDLQIVRLTFTFPERTVCYRVGYMWRNSIVYIDISRSLVGTIGFCVSRSKLEADRHVYQRGGKLILTLFLRPEDQGSARAGTLDAAQNRIGSPGIHRLQSDYRQLLQKGTESDACVVVRGKEFPVHRNVLCVRSTVFEAMFGHDTAEKQSGRVVLDDLDPDSFGDFLEYLYTGDVQDKLSDDNAFGLYVAADKYDVSTLKSECVIHMRRTLSVDSFCDVVTLALLHREEELLQQAISFFQANLKRIIVTAKWQQFALDNGTAANELLIKALVPEKE